MEKIFSKIKPGLLLHIVNRKSEIGERRNLVPNDQFLQASCFRLGKGKTFKAHKHIEYPRSVAIPQESWVVIQGAVKAQLYDIDDSIIAEPVLRAGDISITLFGGHNYVCLEDNTLVYEYKTGPYFGQEKDKAFI